MQCFYIGIFKKSELIGVALAQYLDLNKLESFGERDKCIKTFIRNFIFKNFASHVLLLGNNMITGQNCYAFKKAIDYKTISELLIECANEITNYFKKQNITIHIVSFKDFYQECALAFNEFGFESIFTPLDSKNSTNEGNPTFNSLAAFPNLIGFPEDIIAITSGDNLSNPGVFL